MASSGRFLSSSWYRVALLRPKLRETARVRRHRYRGSAWYVVSDSVNGRVHRLAPAAYGMVAAMDGNRCIDELWSDAAVRLGEEAPSQDEVIQLIGQLHSADLLQGDVPPDAQELFDRRVRLERAKVLRYLLNPLSIRLRLIDPDRFLTATVRYVLPLFGWFGGALWLGVMVPALVFAAQHWPELTDNIGDRVLSADNLLMIALAYPVVKALHELGHGYATKAFGGEVHEMGIMFLVFFPLPYVDATAAAGFRGKWRRTLVGAAGMLVELFIAALALFVWLAVEPGTVRAIAFSVIITAGVTTVLFNGNPLLRYDGYYILADLLEISQSWRTRHTLLGPSDRPLCLRHRECAGLPVDCGRARLVPDLYARGVPVPAIGDVHDRAVPRQSLPGGGCRTGTVGMHRRPCRAGRPRAVERDRQSASGA